MRSVFVFLNVFVLSKFRDIWYYNLVFFINCLRLKRPFYWLNLNNPRTFNEKINYFKNVAISEKSLLANKLLIKDFLNLESLYFPRNLAIFNSPIELNEFDFKSDFLVNGFVMKANHGSGMNLIFHKGELPTKDQINQVIKWFTFPSHLNSRENHYKLIDKKVFIEELISENITDYKIHCFNKKPMFVQVDIDRFKSHKRNIYDLNWDLQQFDINYPKCMSNVSNPIFLNRMIDISIKINQNIGFDYLRIDFYETNEKLYLGEVTFHPGGGVEPFDSYKSDLYLGSLFSI